MDELRRRPKKTVTLSPYVQYSNISTVDSGSDDDLNSISGESIYAGGSVSILFKGRTLHFGPTLSISTRLRRSWTETLWIHQIL